MFIFDYAIFVWINNEMLLAPFSEKEILEAVFYMHPDKSLGPDCMNLAFYQNFWSIVGKDIIAACLSVLSLGVLPAGFNDTQ